MTHGHILFLEWLISLINFLKLNTDSSKLQNQKMKANTPVDVLYLCTFNIQCIMIMRWSLTHLVYVCVSKKIFSCFCVVQGPSINLGELAPSLVTHLEAAATNGCQDNTARREAFEVLEKAWKFLQTRLTTLALKKDWVEDL